MSFNDIIGQDRVCEFLKQAYFSNRLAHAYLFVGPEGSGKKECALEFAKFVNCAAEEGIKKNQGACDKCRNCRKVNNGRHPEIEVITADGASITIEQIRDIQKSVQYKRVESKYRCVIINESDKMTKEAANAFLKTLEEPPQGTIIILLTSGISGLLTTIISRCQLVRFRMLSQEEKTVIVMKGIDASEDDSKTALFSAGGNIKRAREILNDEDDTIELFKNLELAYINKRGSSDVLDMFSDLARDKKRFGAWIDFLVNRQDERILTQKDGFKEIEFLLDIKTQYNRNVNSQILWAKMMLR
ncbi:MAG: DNA polymerase III subunit delta' [Elusimicrobiota bacterium]